MGIQVAQRIAGVRFTKVGKLYHFDASAYPELKSGDFVVVETSRGRQLGQLITFVESEKVDLATLKPIKAPASARDLMMRKLWEAKELEALITCREAASKYQELDTAKWVKAVYNYDGSLLALMYTSEEPLNVNRLRRQLEKEFNHARIELRRIGARDAAKMLGEYGACGGPRCCSTFLTEFSPISIKMAKAQGISLNPSEITGMCGRLRCCLVYEYEQYIEAKKHLPKLGKQIGTIHGPGKVIALNPMADMVTVLVETTRYELHREELVPLEELEALKAKSALGCTKEGSGPCECGARVRGGPTETPSETTRQEFTPGQYQAHKPEARPQAPSQQPRREAPHRDDRRQDATGIQSSAPQSGSETENKPQQRGGRNRRGRNRSRGGNPGAPPQ
jgi:cell fate regulator YaaT (PSP1 superfamily)